MTTNPTEGSGERVSELRLTEDDVFDFKRSPRQVGVEEVENLCDDWLALRRQSQGAGLTDEQREAIQWAAFVAEDCARDVATWPNAPTVSESAKRAAILRALSHPQPSQGACETCGGFTADGVELPVNRHNTDCPDCNGTGQRGGAKG